MPRITIWNHKQIKEYETPPVFSGIERKYFLNLPAALLSILKRFSSGNQIGFHLMFGYFMARKRFFSPDAFHSRDVEFVSRRLGLLRFAFDPEHYKSSTYFRHRQDILKHFAFEPFEALKHVPLLEVAIEEQISSYQKPHYILAFMLEWLEWRHIELPGYHALQVILTDRIRLRNRQISRRFNQLLTLPHKIYLDALLEKQANDFSLLHNLKKLSTSDSPKQISANLEKLQKVSEGFAMFQSLLSQLKFNDKAIRFFGELAIRSTSFQIKRRKEAGKYLLLAAFLVYQLYKFEDWMMDTFVPVCQAFLNKADRALMEDSYLNRKQHRKDLRTSTDMARDYQELVQELRQVVWTDLSVWQKVKQFQALLPQEEQVEDEDRAQELLKIREQHQLDGQEDIYAYLKAQSHPLQLRASPIVKQLHFHTQSSNPDLMKAIKHFCDKGANLTANAPNDFLEEEDQKALFDQQGKFQVSLYKILLFKQMRIAVKSGSLNLQYSFRYKAMDQYLIPKMHWNREQDSLLERANLSHLKDMAGRLANFKKMIHDHFENTNTRILQKKNPHFQRTKKGKYQIKTPKIDKEKNDDGLFPNRSTVPLSEVLATIEQATGYLQVFEHWQPHYKKARPGSQLFFATITAFGCNLGIPTMGQSALNMSAAHLENTANWYFDLENIQKANDVIVNFMDKMELPNIYRKQKEELRTSSDGQKVKVISPNTIYASYSYKYFGKEKGGSSYSFIDERGFPFYSTMITSAEREAPYVLDGLLHNPVIESSFHVTDTHGYSEAIFGIMDLLGFGFAPNIAKLYDQRLYSFEKISTYRDKGYPLLPSAYIQEEKVEHSWDGFLLLACSLKLKYCTASQIFKRFNSYSRQHPLYEALKEYGRMPKTVHVLRFTDDLEMRRDVKFMRNYAENNNKFNNAVFFGNGGEMIFLTRDEQLKAEACKNLIKSAIICWNYIYLTRLIQQTQNEEEKQELLQQIKDTSPMTWKHFCFNGQYDFSEENTSDSFDLLRSQNYSLNLD